jgi:hypothetical protein
LTVLIIALMFMVGLIIVWSFQIKRQDKTRLSVSVTTVQRNAANSIMIVSSRLELI